MFRMFRKSRVDQERQRLLREEEAAWSDHFAALDEVQEGLNNMMQRWDETENRINAAFKRDRVDEERAAEFNNKFSPLKQHRLEVIDFLDQSNDEFDGLEEKELDIAKRINKITASTEQIREIMSCWITRLDSELEAIVLSYDSLFLAEKQSKEKRMAEITSLFLRPSTPPTKSPGIITLGPETSAQEVLVAGKPR